MHVVNVYFAIILIIVNLFSSILLGQGCRKIILDKEVIKENFRDCICSLIGMLITYYLFTSTNLISETIYSDYGLILYGIVILSSMVTIILTHTIFRKLRQTGGGYL
jgi:hypothetical protein